MPCRFSSADFPLAPERSKLPQPGTFWYHPHSNEPVQLELGLYGALIVRGPPPERATRTAEIERLRARGAMTAWVVMILLLYALGAMAVARYL